MSKGGTDRQPSIQPTLRLRIADPNHPRLIYHLERTFRGPVRRRRQAVGPVQPEQEGEGRAELSVPADDRHRERHAGRDDTGTAGILPDRELPGLEGGAVRALDEGPASRVGSPTEDGTVRRVDPQRGIARVSDQQRFDQAGALGRSGAPDNGRHRQRGEQLVHAPGDLLLLVREGADQVRGLALDTEEGAIPVLERCVNVQGEARQNYRCQQER
jgi:hypothetical protein